MANERPQVVIVGAGFGGLWAVRGVAGAPVDVLLVDRNNYHTFLPLLYQVAAAELEPEAIAYPIRSILREMPNARFLLAEVEEVDLAARQLQTSVGPVPYDYLVLALGSAPHFFGVPGAREHAFTLKSMEDAIRLRNHVLGRFEAAQWQQDPDARARALTFVVVGGGPTGVEFAGALAELINGPLRRDYPDLDFRSARVILLEAQSTLLPGLPERLQQYARRRLEQQGGEVRLQAPVAGDSHGQVAHRAGEGI
ncbi:pyridine nucleotide-disulfide oxidoreductase, partial [Litorilinea aerophila]